MDQKLVASLFQSADEDKDGAISGGEAVRFFARSGLAQDILGKIWELASNGQPKLTNPQFYSALRLVSLAQVNQGCLPLDQARVTLSGLGPSLPPPRLTGLENLGIISPFAPQAPQQAAFPTSSPAPAPAPAPKAPSQSPANFDFSSPSPPTATPLAPRPSPVSSATSTISTYPPPSASDFHRYQHLFVQLDTDRDGLVKGGDCFAAFIQWGLDKSVLAQIWDLVAGSSGHLNCQQFCQALNLMEISRKAGGKLPPPPPSPSPSLPPQQQANQAPATWSLQSQFADKPSIAPLAAIPVSPPLPSKFKYSTPDQDSKSNSNDPPSKVPTPPDSSNSLFGDVEKTRLEEEAKVSAAKEAELRAAEAKAKADKDRIKAFNEALQELTVFKGRVNVAILEAQDQASRLQAEADEGQARYEKAYKAAQSASDESKKAVEAVATLLKSKQDAEDKLTRLNKEMAEMASDSISAPQKMAGLQSEVQALEAKAIATEADLKGREQQLSTLRSQKEDVTLRLKEAQEAQSKAMKEAEDAAQEVAELIAASSALRSSGLGGGGAVGGDDVASSNGGLSASDQLVKAARAYRSLLATVLRCGLEIPFEADLLNNGGLLVEGRRSESTGALLAWVDDVVAGAADWNTTQDKDRGYVLVNAMDVRMPVGAPLKPITIAASPEKPALPTSAPATVTASAAPVTFKNTFDAADDVGFGDAPAFAPPAPAPTSPAPAAPAPAPAPAPAAPASPVTLNVEAATIASTGQGLGGFDDAPAFEAPPAPAPAPAPAPPAPAPAAPPSQGFGLATPAFQQETTAPPPPAPFPPPAIAAPAAAPVPSTPAPAAVTMGFDENAFS